jgi:hypothetical protein
MLRTVMNWEVARLKANAARDGALLLIAVGPAVLLLPLDAGEFFETWAQGALVIGWIYALLVAGRLGAETGLLHESAVWLFQKGYSLIDYSIARLVTAAAFTLACIAYGAAWYAVGAAVHGQFAARQHLAWTITVAAVVVISLSILYVVGALGARRSADFLILIAIASLLQDVILSRVSPVLARAAHVLLPPYLAAGQFAVDALNGAAADAMLGAFHIAAFAAVCLAVASVCHGRWRPRLASSS